MHIEIAPITGVLGFCFLEAPTCPNVCALLPDFLHFTLSTPTPE